MRDRKQADGVEGGSGKAKRELQPAAGTCIVDVGDHSG